MDINDLKKITDLLEKFIEPLSRAASSPDAAKELILELGYVPPAQFAFIDQLGSCIQGIEEIITDVRNLADAGTPPDNSDIQDIFTDLTGLIPQLVDLVNNLGDTIQSEFGGQPFATQTDVLVQLPERLFNLLLVRFLEQNVSTTFSVLQLFKVINIRQVEVPDHPLKHPFILYEFNWSKIAQLFSDPKGLLLSALRDATGYFFTDLIYKLQEFGLSLGVSSHFKYPNLDVLELVNNNPNITDWPGLKDLEILRIPFAPSVNPEMGVDVYPLIDTNTNTFTGLVLGIGLETTLNFDISDKFNLSFSLSANLTNGLGFTIDKDDNFRFIADLFTAPESIADNLVVGFEAKLKSIDATNEEPLFRLGTPDGSYFQLGGFTLAFGLENSDQLHLYVESDFRDGKIVIDFSNADGFVSNIAGEGIESNFDLGIGFSNLRGFYFKGGSSLEIALPVHVQLGPIEIQGLTVGMIFQDDKLPITIDSTIAANLGPLQAVVENIGIKADFRITGDKSGNLGPVDLAFGFKPPNGVGLSIDAGVVRGGGYLSFDFDREEYAGALELTFANFLALKAIGLVTTKMPDGSKGFSLLIIITVEFGTGLQLGFGFTLLGVGGLLGLNRASNGEALLAGIRAGSVANIMFPRDVVANAPRIISDLRAFFPAEEGKFLIGPMAKLGWGTPTLVSVSLGVIVEFSTQGSFSVESLTILGVLKVALPTEEAALLQLQVQFLGRIEFDKRRAYFFASLFDSRILFMTIEGEMGMLIDWSDNPNFVLSVGGFHPRFSPPPLPFPAPRRIAVELSNNPFYRVRVEGYFAVTSNTVQFGARAELEFKIGDVFQINGHIAFDALFQFSPFYFIIEISASVSLRLFGMGVFSIRLEFALSGPTPWRARGTGYISFLFFEFSADFDVTWGESANTTLEPVAVLPKLSGELKKEQNWTARLPEGSSIQVSLRKLEGAKDTLVLHPLGTLLITQRLVPLALTLDKLGNQKPSDFKKFDISVEGNSLQPTQADEQFALAQFKNMSDAEKLSQAAFQPMQGGLALSGADNGGYKTGRAVKRIVRYETIVIDTRYRRFQRKFFEWIGTLFTHFFVGGAITKSPLSQHQQKQLQPFADKIEVLGSDLYTVAAMTDNTPFAAEARSFSSEASAREYLQTQVSNNPALRDTLHVIPQYEANL